MAKSLKIRVGHLLPEFLADALVLLGPLQAAGAVSASALQTLPDHGHHFLVIVETYSHRITSFLPYYSQSAENVKTKPGQGPGVFYTGTRIPWRTNLASLKS